MCIPYFTVLKFIANTSTKKVYTYWSMKVITENKALFYLLSLGSLSYIVITTQLSEVLEQKCPPIECYCFIGRLYCTIYWINKPIRLVGIIFTNHIFVVYDSCVLFIIIFFLRYTMYIYRNREDKNIIVNNTCMYIVLYVKNLRDVHCYFVFELNLLFHWSCNLIGLQCIKQVSWSVAFTITFTYLYILVLSILYIVKPV